MACTKPMTLEQPTEAIAAYRSFRRNLRAIRRKLPPESAEERDALLEYQLAINALGLETAKPLAWIDPNRLNRFEEAARKAIVSYMKLKMD